MHKQIYFLLFSISLFLISACDLQSTGQSAEDGTQAVSVVQTGWLSEHAINEASGLQASYGYDGDFFLHNDEGEPIIYVSNEAGADIGSVSIVPAKNKDWEDITSVPVDTGRWIVAGDIGDNMTNRKSIKLYFAKEPQPGKDHRYAGQQTLEHWLVLTYPDGPRDCESMAYDPVGRQILLLSKRDKPARLYAIDLETALTRRSAELKFLGTVGEFRAPTVADRAKWGGRTDWISQPTGFDISADGNEAVVITYRSLYRYHRNPDESWLSALQRKPEEVIGPPAAQNEAVAYSVDGKSIYVTTEKLPTPMFRFKFRDKG